MSLRRTGFALVSALAMMTVSAIGQQVLTSPKPGVVVVEPDPKPMSNGTGLIAGQVVISPSTPGAGALLTLTLPGGERAAVLANTDGRFVFAALPAGPFTLTASSTRPPSRS